MDILVFPAVAAELSHERDEAFKVV